MNPLSRFSDRATDYASYRPGYPVEAISYILAGLGHPSQLVAADIGAGTGISSRLLADRGVQAIAIEPNAEMRQATRPHPLVKLQAGSAEHIDLPDASVNLVTCFQSFHWFEPAIALAEFRRILQPKGRLALVWNNRDARDGFTRTYSQLIRKVCGREPPHESYNRSAALANNPYFVQSGDRTFAYRQELDLAGLIGRANSSSYVPLDASVQQQLISGCKELYAQWADESGLVYLAYKTNVYLADL